MQKTYRRLRYFVQISVILVKTESCHLHQLTQKISDQSHAYRTAKNGDLLVRDSGDGDEERIFIFTSQGAFSLDSEHSYADGTFKACQEVFVQLYNIHGQCDGRIFLCAFSLLPNKNENTYNRVFEQLFQLVNNLGNSPNDVLVNSERSAINAFQNRSIDI